MTRRSPHAALALATVFLSLALAHAANAVEITSLGPTTIYGTGIGEFFTIDLALTNDSASPVRDVQISLTGLNDVSATVVSGVTASRHFVTVCLPNPDECYGGLPSTDNAFFDPNDLTLGYAPGDDSLPIVNAYGIQTTTSTGALDPGLDGGLLDPSDRDVTLQLVSTLPVGQFAVEGEWFDGTTWTPFTPIEFTLLLDAVPEPGTACLLGLGLAGFSATRRTRRRRALGPQ